MEFNYQDFESLENFLNEGVNLYELSQEELEILYAVSIMVDNKYSIRETARECCMARATLHKRIHRILPKISLELYDVVKRILYENSYRGNRR